MRFDSYKCVQSEKNESVKCISFSSYCVQVDVCNHSLASIKVIKYLLAFWRLKALVYLRYCFALH